MLRKKFFKILSVLVAIIVTSCLFVLPASAETTTTDFFDFFSPNVAIYHWSGTEVTSDLTNGFSVSFTDNEMELRVTNGAVLPSNSWIVVDCTFLLNSPYNKSGFSSGGFSIFPYSSRYSFSLAESDVNYTARKSFSGDLVYGTVSTTGQVLDVYFSENNQQTAFESIDLAFVITTQVDLINGMVLPFFFRDLSYSYTNPTQDITDSISQNTDKIIGGWSPDSSLDSSTFEDYDNKEQQILDGTLQGRDSAISMFNNFGSLFTSGHIFNGLLAVSSVLTQFFQIEWLSSVVQLSLTLGVFAFLIGTVQLVVSRAGRTRRSDARSRRRNK